jgi:hypothetical protein
MSGLTPPNIKLPLSIHTHRRGRSSSFLKVEHVDSSNEVALDQAAYANPNAEWVNRKGVCFFPWCHFDCFYDGPPLVGIYIGAWMIHVVLVAAGKVIIDVIPGVTQNISWTAVNLTYLAVRTLPHYPMVSYPPSPIDPTVPQCSYLMFHWVTGIPFGSELHGGAYDDLTLWEQIDGGAQNTPSKKWLFSVPVGLYVSRPLPSTHTHTTATQNRFLLSTHYTNYNPWLFAINLSALIFVLVPKLPIVRPTSLVA